MFDGGLPFWKTEGAGNDLPLVDARKERRPETLDWPALARRMCDRRFGVGGDGLMALEGSSRGVAQARMFNPDGTEDFCGNGLRCVAAYLCHRGEGADVAIETPRGLHRARTTATGPREYEVDVEIMEPRFDAASVPALAQGDMVERVLDLGDVKRVVTSVGMGTTHTVIFSDQEVDEAAFLRDSPRIETLPLYPERTSVLWARVVSPERVEMRIWERGVGETLACGTGACAVAAAGQRLGKTGSRVEVVTRGGRLRVAWAGRGPARLIGPARIVYWGELWPETG